MADGDVTHSEARRNHIRCVLRVRTLLNVFKSVSYRSSAFLLRVLRRFGPSSKNEPSRVASPAPSPPPPQWTRSNGRHVTSSRRPPTSSAAAYELLAELPLDRRRVPSRSTIDRVQLHARIFDATILLHRVRFAYGTFLNDDQVRAGAAHKGDPFARHGVRHAVTVFAWVRYRVGRVPATSRDICWAVGLNGRDGMGGPPRRGRGRDRGRGVRNSRSHVSTPALIRSVHAMNAAIMDRPMRADSAGMGTTLCALPSCSIAPQRLALSKSATRVSMSTAGRRVEQLTEDHVSSATGRTDLHEANPSATTAQRVTPRSARIRNWRSTLGSPAVRRGSFRRLCGGCCTTTHRRSIAASCGDSRTRKKPANELAFWLTRTAAATTSRVCRRLTRRASTASRRAYQARVPDMAGFETAMPFARRRQQWSGYDSSRGESPSRPHRKPRITREAHRRLRVTCAWCCSSRVCLVLPSRWVRLLDRAAHVLCGFDDAICRHLPRSPAASVDRSHRSRSDRLKRPISRGIGANSKRP